MTASADKLQNNTDNIVKESISAKVSLIVPMYCCEKYVVSLLDNLCGQDYRDIEIICVIDGSPDKTLELVESYAGKDPRIRVLSQEHKGAGAARNLGLSSARGRYLMFPDADDEYAVNYVSRLLEAVETNNADIAVCQIARKDHALNTHDLFCGYKCILYPKDKAIRPSSIKHYTDAISHLSFNKIFRADLIRSNNLRFSETKSINDIFFSTASLICANSIVLVSDHLVTYNLHRSPLSVSSTRSEHSHDIATVYRQLYSWLDVRGKADELFSDYCLKWSGTLRDYAKYSDDDKLVNVVVGELAKEMPWTDMSGNELRQRSQLYGGVARRALKKSRRKLKKQSALKEKGSALKQAAKYAEREERFFTEVIQVLRNDYGIKFSKIDTYPYARLMQVKQYGLFLSMQTACRMILNRTAFVVRLFV